MKKLISLITAIAVTASVLSLSACTHENKDSGKIKIITTLFPQYDFAKTIAGEHADVKLLIKPGAESHSYEPTSADMMEIADASMFIYTGDSMENWAKTILDSVKNDSLSVVDVSEGVKIATVDEVSSYESSAHSHTDEETHEDEHSHGIYDPHIWTDPQNAEIIVSNILNALIKLDPDNREIYEKNAENLIKELRLLDKDFETFFSSCENKKIVFGGKFAMYYFAKRYDLQYEAAYDSCSGESEASPGKIAELIEDIKSENLRAVFYEELENPSVAQTIAKETNTQALLLHSCHNVTKDEFESGATYISLMRQNLENLKKGMK